MSERIYKEYMDLRNNPMNICGITVGCKDDSYYNLRFTLMPPKDTPYKEGLFFLNAHFPSDYPNSPPEVNFETPIYHMNVNPYASKENVDESLGHVRISILNCWKPQYNIKEVLLNVCSLFYMVNLNRAYGKEIVKEYEEDEGAVYFEKAKYFTKKYADCRNFNRKIDENKDWDFIINK